MSENETVHQDELETEEVIDLEEFENSQEDEPIEDGQEPEENELPELEDDPNWTPDERKKRWDEQLKGLKKLKKQADERASRAQVYLDHEDQVKYLINTGQKLATKDTSLTELKSIVSELQARHGFDDNQVAEALGFTKGDDDELLFADNEDVYKRAKADALKELEAKYGDRFSKLEQIESERAEASQLSRFVDEKYPSIMKHLAEMTGVKVNLSKSQVEKAIKAKPEIAKDDPADAVYLYWKSTIKRAQAKRLRAAQEKGPEGVKGSSRSGSGVNKSGKMSLSEAARARGYDPKELFKDFLDI